jgi:hypothetical protein
MIVIQDEKHFDEVVAHAKAIGLYGGTSNDNLKNRLDYLAKYGGKNNAGSDRTRVRLFKDFAPYSFGLLPIVSVRRILTTMVPRDHPASSSRSSAPTT